MGKDGGQWEVEEDEEGGQNGKGRQGDMRWQVVEDKQGGGDEERRGGMKRQWEMDEDDRKDGEIFRE